MRELPKFMRESNRVPAEGSKIRKFFDTLYEKRGEFIDLKGLFDSKTIGGAINQLRLFYDCDIRMYKKRYALLAKDGQDFYAEKNWNM